VVAVRRGKWRRSLRTVGAIWMRCRVSHDFVGNFGEDGGGDSIGMRSSEN